MSRSLTGARLEIIMTFLLLGKDEIIKELLLQHTAFLYIQRFHYSSLYIYIITFTAFTARDITQLYSAGNFLVLSYIISQYYHASGGYSA